MKVADYKELRVYRLAYDSAMDIFRLSRSWPSEERFSLIDQVRRSSRSVCTNIAEAWRKRRYEAAFISKLSDSDTEAAETEVHLSFARDCGYLPADTQARLMDQYDHICRQLTRMMDDAASWCGTGGELREGAPEYWVGTAEREEREERSGVKKTPSRSDAQRSTRSARSDAPRSTL